MDDRDRAAPVALARDQPVAQAELHLALAHRPAADLLPAEQVGDPVEGLLRLHAVEEARVDHDAVVDIGLFRDAEGGGVPAFRHDHRHHRQAVLVGEVEVALVARRAAEDGAGAVVHQHEVGDVDRHRPAVVEGMDDANPGVEAHLLGGLDLGGRGTAPLEVVDEGLQRRVLLRRRPGQRMVGGDRHEGGAEDRVGARRVDLELGLARRRGAGRQRPADQQALGAADPVGLHQLDLLGPAVEPVEAVEQVLAHRGDLEEPLGQVAQLDRGTGAPALAVDDLLVGEHGHVDRIPVDLGRLALDEPRLPEVEEHLLLVAIIGRIAGGQFAGPVERQAHRLQLALHRLDVLVGPVARVDAIVARRILGRQAEGVPAHRVQHVVAHGAAPARDHVAHRIVAHMAHVDAPRRIGEHLEHVVFRPRVVVLRLEQLRLVPGRLPAGFGSAGIVSFGCHDRDFT